MFTVFLFMMSYDPPGTSECALDPLGLYQIADQLAVQLVPAVREWMQRIRFLTAMAVGAMVTEDLEDDPRQRDASPYRDDLAKRRFSMPAASIMGTQTAAERPTVPPLKMLPRRAFIDVVVQAHGGLLQGPSAGRLQSRCGVRRQGPPVLRVHSDRVAEPGRLHQTGVRTQ